MPGKLRRIHEFNAALEPVASFDPKDPTDRILLRLAVKAMRSTGELNDVEKVALGRLMGGKSFRQVELLLEREPLASADALTWDEVIAHFPKPAERQALLRYIGLLGRVDANLDRHEFAFWSELERKLRIDER